VKKLKKNLYNIVQKFDRSTTFSPCTLKGLLDSEDSMALISKTQNLSVNNSKLKFVLSLSLKMNSFLIALDKVICKKFEWIDFSIQYKKPHLRFIWDLII
jgi:hypothetical protein